MVGVTSPSSSYSFLGTIVNFFTFSTWERALFTCCTSLSINSTISGALVRLSYVVNGI